MFEAIANPPKNKGKEKDVGKRRAYVRVVTSLGGASLNLELFCEKVGGSLNSIDCDLI
jgi:peptidyl-prolyl cis-trans isomerase-like protein 2